MGGNPVCNVLYSEKEESLCSVKLQDSVVQVALLSNIFIAII